MVLCQASQTPCPLAPSLRTALCSSHMLTGPSDEVGPSPRWCCVELANLPHTYATFTTPAAAATRTARQCRCHYHEATFCSYSQAQAMGSAHLLDDETSSATAQCRHRRTRYSTPICVLSVISMFGQVKPHPWSKIFRSRATPEAVDLVSKLLQYSPEKRLTPLEACIHPFFDELRDPKLHLPNGRPSELFKLYHAYRCAHLLDLRSKSKP